MINAGTINRLLVANRGEIARRVFATCRRLGIETVAVHSDADAGLPHVTDADLAVRLPGNTPAETYLDADRVLDAARRAGADAIHPGYGFLSENADFARAVEAAGLIWVGPSPASIEAMGSKVRAKELMREAGVPVLEAPEEPTDSDLPLLVKASAGGGGRGMRIVRALDTLDAEIEAARAEAASAFGDGTVFVEPYVEHGRHIEVQVLGDPALGIVHVLGERDCTVQRRHQKVVEESPAPGLSDEQRQALHDAARDAAAAIDYRGAGTIEFLVDAENPDRFWFLEMNTRLQVEHPVTEAVTGLDLVELQLAVAEGRAADADEVAMNGHAIEVRLYAEDPAEGYQPQSGRLVSLDVDHDVAFEPHTRTGVRLDSGFEAGSDVSTYYDAMLAKVIAWAPTREQAVRILMQALRRARLHGLVTNRDQLLDILAAPAFAAMDVTTGWLDGREPRSADPDPWALTAAALALAAGAADRRTVQQGVPAAWRNVTSQPQTTVLEVGDEQHTVSWWGTRDGFVVEGATVREASPTRVVLDVDGLTLTYAVTSNHGQEHVLPPGRPRELYVDGPGLSVVLRAVPRFTDPADAVASGSLLAPMPGSVVRVIASVGDEVEAGAPVLVLEAMKMQHTVAAPHAGTVSQIEVQPGQQVAAGEVLAVVEEQE